MDLMYKEHSKHEKSSPGMNNQSNSSNSSTNLGDKHSSLVNETDDKMGPPDDDKRSAQPIVSACEEDVSRGNNEDTFNNQVGSVVSAFNEFTTERDKNSVEESCGKEDFLESVYNSRDVVIDNSDISDEKA